MTAQQIYEKIKTHISIIFKEDTHQYFIENQEYHSVSKVLGTIEKPFDEKGMSLKCSVNPEHEHFGKTSKQIIDIWADSNKLACDNGHTFHLYAENWIRLSYEEDSVNESFLGNEICQIIDKNRHLEPYFAAFNLFFAKNICQNNYQLVGLEVQIASKKYKICGTFDALFMYLGMLIIFDWKTNKKFDSKNSYKLNAPYQDYDSSKHTYYTFQVHIYKWILENEYGIPIKDSRIIWFHNGEYQIFKPAFAYNAEFIESILERYHKIFVKK
jgi:hypothetical protein